MKLRLATILVMLVLAGCAAAPGARTGAELVLRSQADAAYARGDTAVALTAYRQLATDGVNDSLVWTRLGNLELLQKHPHRAADAYSKAVQLDPADTEAWHNMAIIRLRQAGAMLERERASLKKGDPRDAKIRCEQARLATVLSGHTDSHAECRP